MKLKTCLVQVYRGWSLENSTKIVPGKEKGNN